MRRRAFVASTGALLAGCLGRGASKEEPTAGAEVTSTADGTPGAPLVNFAIELEVDRSVATITHQTGEPIEGDRTDRIELMLTTAPDHPIPTVATLTPTKTLQVIRRTWREVGGGYPIVEGDAVEFLEATPGDTLEVWWYGTAHHHEGVRLEAATFAKV